MACKDNLEIFQYVLEALRRTFRRFMRILGALRGSEGVSEDFQRFSEAYLVIPNVLRGILDLCSEVSFREISEAL